MTGRELIAKLHEYPDMLDRELVTFKPGMYRRVESLIPANIPADNSKRADVVILAQGGTFGPGVHPCH